MIWKFEKQCEQIKERDDYMNVAELVRLEAQLTELRQMSGLSGKRSLLLLAGDAIFSRSGAERINRSRYIRLAVCGGWFLGLHRFYARQYVTGSLYLLFCWTGIPLAMTLLDLMSILPQTADENGEIIL